MTRRVEMTASEVAYTATCDCGWKGDKTEDIAAAEDEMTGHACQDDSVYMFTRDELQGLVTRCGAIQDTLTRNRWHRAIGDLAMAASVLDAFIARTEL